MFILRAALFLACLLFSVTTAQGPTAFKADISVPAILGGTFTDVVNATFFVQCPIMPFAFDNTFQCPTTGTNSLDLIHCNKDPCASNATIIALPLGFNCPDDFLIEYISFNATHYNYLYPKPCPASNPSFVQPLPPKITPSKTASKAASTDHPVKCGDVPFFFDEGFVCPDAATMKGWALVCEQNTCEPDFSWLAIGITKGCPSGHTPAQLIIGPNYFDVLGRTVCSKYPSKV